MKIVYMNDERAPVAVRINDDGFYKALDAGQDLSKWHTTLQACESRVFELETPADAIPYVKKWPGMVMLSYVDQNSLASFYPQPSQPQDEASDT